MAAHRQQLRRLPFQPQRRKTVQCNDTDLFSEKLCHPSRRSSRRDDRREPAHRHRLAATAHPLAGKLESHAGCISDRQRIILQRSRPLQQIQQAEVLRQEFLSRQPFLFRHDDTFQ